ncbi:MAG: HEAT repeat domain-containing protein [Gammaproteobacteria bacterium]
MSTTAATAPPDALLYIANGCPHCPTVLQGLSELVKSGAVGRLEVVNITRHPEAAQRAGVRAVPWLRLGPFILTGLRAPAELARWAQRAESTQGMAEYLSELLTEGNLAEVRATLARAPQAAAALVLLLGDPEAELQVRLGAAAVIEDLEGSEALAGQVEALGALTRHADARIRVDAAHALGLSHAAAARAWLEALREDRDGDVREEAEEGLARL